MNSQLRFEHELVETTTFAHSWTSDDDEGYDAWGGVAVADFDGDGRDEYATGGRRSPEGGYYHLYDRGSDGQWTRREITDTFRPGVGAAAADVDGDEYPEIISSEWGSRLFVVDANPKSDDFGNHRVVYDGFDSGPHDVVAADIDGDGAEEIVTREKDGSLFVFLDPDSDEHWQPITVASELTGDGTAVADLSDGPGLDLVTNRGWFENVDGSGAEWQRRPLVDERLEWAPETRIAVGDVDGDGADEVVLTESELDVNARLAVLSQTENGPWEANLVFDAAEDRRAMHSLQLADLDGDGQLEIFTAEMENDKTDGVEVQPRWWCLRCADGAWEREVLYDENAGTHCARVLDVDGDGRLDILGKVWRANTINAYDGQNHVDCLRNVTE